MARDDDMGLFDIDKLRELIAEIAAPFAAKSIAIECKLDRIIELLEETNHALAHPVHPMSLIDTKRAGQGWSAP